MITIVPFLNKVNALILNPIIYLIFILSFVYFCYGVVKFLTLEAGDAKRVEARNSMIWGIVGMVIMFSAYGLIRFILATFGVSESEVPYIW